MSVNLPPTNLRRRRVMRMIVYGLFAVLVILLLLVYSLYLSARRPPTFYKEVLETSEDVLQYRNREMLDRVRVLNNEIQKTDRPWESVFTDEQLNAYLAVEATKKGANILPRELDRPRLKLTKDGLEIASGAEYGSLDGIIHLKCAISLAGENKVLLQIKQARLGHLAISRKIPTDILAAGLKKAGYETRILSQKTDPTLEIILQFKYGKNKIVHLESIDFSDGSVRFTGRTEVVTGD